MENKDKKDFKRRNFKKRPRNGNSGKSNPRDYRNSKREKEFDEREATQGKGKAFQEGTTNDPAWYKFNDQLVKDATDLQFFTRIGDLIKQTSITLPNLEPYQWKTYMPSLMNIRFTPTLGTTEDGVDAPVNQQAKAFRTFVQSTVSSKVDFKAADVGIHIGALDSVYMMYYWAQRLYGVFRTRMTLNTTIPDVYLESMGFDPLSMESQMGWSDFHASLDAIGAKLSTIYFPTGLAIYERHFRLVSNIYADDRGAKAQQYIFNPKYVWRYALQSSGSSHPGGSLRLELIPDWKSPDDDGRTGLNKFIAWLNKLINDTIYDATFDKMNQWFLRAYGFDGCMHATLIDKDYMVVPVYQEEILPQIHNMDIVGDPNYFPDEAGATALTGYYYQYDQDYIKWVPYFKDTHGTASWRGNDNKLIDIPYDNIGVDDILVATRLMVTGKAARSEEVGGYLAWVTSYGTELVNDIQIFNSRTEWTNDNFGAGNPVTFSSLQIGTTPNKIGTYQKYTAVKWAHICSLTHFKLSPMIKITNEIR